MDFILPMLKLQHSYQKCFELMGTKFLNKDLLHNSIAWSLIFNVSIIWDLFTKLLYCLRFAWLIVAFNCRGRHKCTLI